MYLPPAFTQNDPDRLREFIEQNSFALLVTQSGGEPAASHLPLLLDRQAGMHGCLVGHMARANPQWHSADGRCGLAIFHGPHAYISPSWYESANAVPTWNYLAVHVYGTIRLVADPPRLRQIVRRTVDLYEAHLPSPWSIEMPSDGFIDGLLAAIIGFQIEIQRIEGTWKLSQNQDQPRREKVIHALRAAGAEDGRKIADLMSQTPTLSECPPRRT